jgi:thiol:disulfide interchange protein
MKKRVGIIFFAMLALAQIAPVNAQQSTAPGAAKGGLGSLFSSASEDELIEPDLAFKFNVTVKGPNTLIAQVSPAKGYYAYKEKMRFTLKDAKGVTISGIKLPAGEVKVDQTFGKTEVYRKTMPAEITLNRTSKANNITLVASYQGCHEKLGVCYPPIEKTVNLTLP